MDGAGDGPAQLVGAQGGVDPSRVDVQHLARLHPGQGSGPSGPGLAVVGVAAMMTVLTTTTPIDRRHCRLDWHFHVAAPLAHLADDMVAGVTGEYGLMADVPIWRDKVFLDRPVLVKGDGNIAEFRRWYAQFYEDG